MQLSESPRDRKRSETFRRIHEAAVELTLRDGVAAATVSEIAERAEVSRRTFFNYYPCKEDAILDLRELQIPAETVEAFLRPARPARTDDEADTSLAEDRFLQALELTVSTMASHGPRPDERLRTIVAAHPELIDRIRSHRDATQEVLFTALTERLTEQDGPPRSARSVRALILLGGAVLRFAYHENSDVLNNPDPATIQNAMAAFRNALKELQ